jgi:hypothetical protein
MRRDKENALQLRLKGKSYTEIQTMLGVPKGTLSGWFSNLALSDEAKARIKKRLREGSMRGLLQRNKLQSHVAAQHARAIRQDARRQIPQLDHQNVFLAGIALYWAEGYKLPITRNGKTRTFHPVSLTNADPQLVKMFMKFLREVCQVADEKIIISVRLYQHLNEEHTIQYWSRVTGLSRGNFRKSYYGISRSSLHKRPYTRLPYGTVQIRVNDTKLFHRIMGWIEGLAQHV